MIRLEPLALAFAFEALNLRTVRAVCLEANATSIRVLRRLGFTESRRFLQYLSKWPEPRPSIEFTLDREAWQPHLDGT